MPSSAETLISAAYAAGYDALSTRDLQEALLYAAQSGGGGGGGLSGSGSPQGVVNGGSGQTYLDTATNNLWISNGGGLNNWVLIIG